MIVLFIQNSKVVFYHTKKACSTRNHYQNLGVFHDRWDGNTIYLKNVLPCTWSPCFPEIGPKWSARQIPCPCTETPSEPVSGDSIPMNYCCAVLSQIAFQLVTTLRKWKLMNCKLKWDITHRCNDNKLKENKYGTVNKNLSQLRTVLILYYRSGTVNSKFHLIRSFSQIFARFLSFHV